METSAGQVRNEAGEGGRAIVEAFIGGTAFLTLQPLPSGTPFDIFCYAEDIFRAFEEAFGGARRPRGPPRGRDVQVQTSLSLEEAAMGVSKTIAWRSPS